MAGTSTQPRAVGQGPAPDGHRAAGATFAATATAPRAGHEAARHDGATRYDEAGPAPTRNGGHPSTADLIRRATEQVSTLVRDELALARAEMTEKVSHFAKGAGMLGAGALLALYGLLALLAGVVLVLGRVIPVWAAALVIGAALLLIAGALAMAGLKQVKRGTPPVPKAAVEGVRTDIETVASAVEDRGHHR